MPSVSSPLALEAARDLRASSSPGRSARVVLELASGAAALLLGLVLVAHLVFTARADVFFYNGDSVLMPLVEQSFRAGEPFQWAMSSVLFLVPEIPVYAVVAQFAPPPQAALVVNALVVVVGLYALVRWCVGVAARSLSVGVRILIALVPLAVLVACSLFEHTDERESFELVSLLVTTTYYYGTALALVATIALVVTASTRPLGRRRAPLVALGVVAALATFSNPLFAVWAVGPALVALAVVHRRDVVRRAPLAIAMVLALGTLAGWLARIPMQRYISIQLDHYFRAYRMARSFAHYLDRSWWTASSWEGAIEMSVLGLGVFGTLAVAAVALRRGWPLRIRLGLVLPAASIVVTGVVAVMLGTTATRYLLPFFLAPAVASAVLLVHLAERLPALAPRPALPPTLASSLRPGRLRGDAARLAALVAAGGLLVGTGSVVAIRAAPSIRNPAAVECVAGWVGGRDLTGAGQFWTIRALEAYGPVRLLQVGPRYGASLWLDNAADFRSQQVSYLVTDDRSVWSKGALASLGTPRQRVHCGRYTILDYEGTPGQAVLTDRIARTASASKAARGLGG